MDDWGNVVDCAALATISALLHFRRPEVTVSGNEVTVVSLLSFSFV
jgi:exosome complex component RRP45